MAKFINESGLKFIDISSEKSREYSCGLVIEKPLKLHVDKNDRARIFDDAGFSYFVDPAKGWWIKWKAKEGEPNFVK
jgi:hypothetical protein